MRVHLGLDVHSKWSVFVIEQEDGYERTRKQKNTIDSPSSWTGNELRIRSQAMDVSTTLPSDPVMPAQVRAVASEIPQERAIP